MSRQIIMMCYRCQVLHVHETSLFVGDQVDLSRRPYRCDVDGRQIRGAVEAAAASGYLEPPTGAAGVLPAVLRALNEIAGTATKKLADEAGFGEGARLATSRRAMLAAIDVVAETLRAELPARVKDLRDEGVTWREIGELLGLTSEGAQRRFDPVAAAKAREASRRARERLRETQGTAEDTSRSLQRPGRRRRSGRNG
jgi:hypothetical protein